MGALESIVVTRSGAPAPHPVTSVKLTLEGVL
jgi:hypothetical protein